jgi:N-acetyl sugar amidotransferase
MNTEYKICTKTVMDTTDPNIQFDENGVCSYVKVYEKTCAELLVPESDQNEKLNALVKKIKGEGKNKQYDCIIGLSGGVDSTYVALLVRQLGLRPLAVHLDNGWNSELAVNNIENIVKKLNLDLFTYVIDWEEFKDLQLAYLRASVVDIEALTDNAILVAINRIAKKFDLKYFISGTNLATEFIMPKTWFFDVKYDSLNIKAIHKKFGKIKKLTTYPIFGFWEYLLYRYYKKEATTISILNYVPYKKQDVIPLIERELGWRNYGGKHSESKFTEFYQNYILPKKFNVDKRKAFFSTLILSGQMNRDEALSELQKPIQSPTKLEDDVEYVVKKFNITRKEFDEIMSSPPQSHFKYPSYEAYHQRLRSLVKKIIGHD